VETVVLAVTAGAVIVAVYIWVVVRTMREIRETSWLGVEARTIWVLVVILWIPFGPFAWVLYNIIRQHVILSTREI